MVLAPAFGACVLRREQSERRSRDGDAAAAAVGVSEGGSGGLLSPGPVEGSGLLCAGLHGKPVPARVAAAATGPRDTS